MKRVNVSVRSEREGNKLPRALTLTPTLTLSLRKQWQQ